jgi:GDP-L-fucose synthase
VFDLKGARVWVAGHRGMVGSAIWRAIEADPTLSDVDLIGWSRSELDLTDRGATLDAAAQARPDVVVLAAARVGGIVANDTWPVEFLTDNLRIQANVMEAAHATGVDRLLFLGSSCIYPRDAPQPMAPDMLMTGPLEPTNDAYAIAKLAGITAVRSYRRQYGRSWISCLPTNLYGPGDNFDLDTSHVLPALIRRFDEAARTGAPTVTLWGTGKPRREFLHVDDLAAACVRLLTHYDDPTPINIGYGEDLIIAELATLIARITGFAGDIEWDVSRPDGTPQKLLDIDPIRTLGWTPNISLEDGIRATWGIFRQQHDQDQRVHEVGGDGDDGERPQARGIAR